MTRSHTRPIARRFARPPGTAEGKNPDLSAQVLPRRRWQRVFGWAIAPSLLAIGALAALAWYTRPLSKTAERPRLSVVVLPFENLGGDPADNYLADSVTGEVTTDLSRVPNTFVIARSSAERYRGKSDDPMAIGEQLGVRYLVNGSIRKLGDTVRVNAQLIATETAAKSLGGSV